MTKLGLFLQNSLVEYIGVYSDTNYNLKMNNRHLFTKFKFIDFSIVS